MRIFLDNKGVSTLWSQFKAKLAVHANNSDIHVTAEEKAAWDGKAEISDIPTTLPANGGNADTLDGKHAAEFAPYHRYAPIYTGDILDIPEMGTYSCDVDGCTNLPSEIASWCYVTAFDFRDAGYKRFICVALNDIAVYPNVIWLASESNKTSDGKLIWSKANDGGNAATLDGKHASDLAYLTNVIGGLRRGYASTNIGTIMTYGDRQVVKTTNDLSYFGWGVDGEGWFFPVIVSQYPNGTKYKIFEFDCGYDLVLTTDPDKVACFDYKGRTYYACWQNLGSLQHSAVSGGLRLEFANDYISMCKALIDACEAIDSDTLDGLHASDFADNIYKGYPKEGNCNNATAQGVYTVSNNSTNAPGSDFYTLIVDVAGDGTWIVQNAISAGTESVAYRRTCINGNWGAWKNIADGGNAATVNGYTVNANVPAGFSSIGQDTENKAYTYRGTTYTGHNTSEVFNNYTENMAANEYSHAEGYDTKALGDHSHAEGSGTKALGFHSHAECSSTEASGDCSHAEGMDTTASGECSHAEGSMTTASSSASHAEGSDTRASGNNSHAEGSSTKASGMHSHAEGHMSEASGEGSHVEGSMTSASSSASHAEGYGTTASSFASHAGGKYNKAMTNSTGETDNTGDAFVIGNGTETYTLSNAFRVTYGGAVYGLSAFNSSGADYAEFIKPWYDGNTEEEDRVGYFVTIKDGLLYKANEGDYIVGITSGNPSVVGNADEDYYWRYARDEFNRFVYEDAEEEVEQLDDDGAPVLDENGMPVMVKTGNIIKNAHYKLAADYNPTKQNDYIERKNRPEWSYVGMVGVIPVRDDGTCEAGCFCKCGQNGIATRAESRGFDTFFVIERLSDNVVSVEIR